MDENSKGAVWKREEIASPCIQVCVIHRAEGICTGCYRTIEEITDWSRFTSAQREQLMQELPARESRLKKRRGERLRKTV